MIDCQISLYRYHSEPTETVPTATIPLIPTQLATPEKFSGTSGDCRPFLIQCELNFELQAATFQSERSKIAYLTSHLTGKGEAWATAEWSRKSPLCESFCTFFTSLHTKFSNSFSWSRGSLVPDLFLSGMLSCNKRRY